MKQISKWLGVLLAVCLLAGLLPLSALAANGPSQAEEFGWYYAYLNFYRPDEGGAVPDDGIRGVYADRTVYNQMDGAVYDLATNTLTITELKAADWYLTANAMGDDFTINVVGECELAAITVWGYMHGGGLNVIGTGSLTVNANKRNEHAVTIRPEGAAVIVTVDPSVTLDLYGSEAPLLVYGEAENMDGAAVTADGKALALNQEQVVMHLIKWINGYVMDESSPSTWGVGDRVTKESDPDGFYTARTAHWQYSDGTEADVVTLHKLVYSESQQAYFDDQQFVAEYGNDWGDVDLSPEEYAALDFTPVLDEYDNPVPADVPFYGWTTSVRVCVDANGTEYGVMDDFSDGEQTVRVYDIIPVTDLNEYGSYYMLALNESVSPDGLTETYEDVVQEGMFELTLSGTEYHHQGAGDSASRGDVDGSGKVDASDALMALKTAVGKITLSAEQKAAADLDGDGNITASDALTILKIAVGK